MLSCVFMYLPLVMMLAWVHFQYHHMVVSHLLIIGRNMRSSIYIPRWILDLPKQRDQNISGTLRCYAINAWELLSERLINRIVNWPADLPLGPSASIWPDLIGGVTLMSSVMSHILTHLRPPLQATVPTVWCLGFNSVWDGDKQVFQRMSYQSNRPKMHFIPLEGSFMLLNGYLFILWITRVNRLSQALVSQWVLSPLKIINVCLCLMGAGSV